MQKAEQRRLDRNESTRKYYKKLKERAAQGDVYAQEILERQRAAVRKSVKRWKKSHPEQNRQYKQKVERSDRYRAYKREYMRQRRARKKAEEPPTG